MRGPANDQPFLALKATKARSLAQQFPTARLLLNGEAAQNAEIIVLATPWQSTEEAVRTCGDLQGKTIIDCTNPLKSDFSGLEIGFSASGGEFISEWAHHPIALQAEVIFRKTHNPQTTVEIATLNPYAKTTNSDDRGGPSRGRERLEVRALEQESKPKG
jgi:hypothetical protein